MNELISYLSSIVLLIGVLMFLIFLWLVGRKKKPKTRKSNIIRLIGYAFLSVILFVCGVIMCIVIGLWIMLTPPKVPFDRDTWLDVESIEDRYTMSRDLVKRQKLIGMTCEEVESLLGRDFMMRRDRRVIVYFTGHMPSIMTHVPQTLEICFANERVYKVTINQTDKKEISDSLKRWRETQVYENYY